jgi:hypothetical protein
MPYTRSRSGSGNFQVLFPHEFHTLVSHVALQLAKTDKIEGHHISWNPSKAFLVPHIVILLFGFSSVLRILSMLMRPSFLERRLMTK